MNNQFPFELLVKILKDIEKDDVRQCLQVNKLWSKAARLFIKKALHVTLTEESTLYQDLLHFPLLASRVTKLTINSNDTLYCILTLSLCPNILHLDFYKCSPNRLLDRLTESEYTLLPKVRDITAGPGDYETTKILLPCRWRHRATITRLTAYEVNNFILKHAQDLPEFISHFPQLEEVAAVNNMLPDVNLHRLLAMGKNLRKIRLEKTTSYYDNRGNPEASLSTKLKEFSNYGPVHISALQFLAEISSNSLKKFLITTGSVVVDENQDKDELLDHLVKRFSSPNIELEPTEHAFSCPHDLLWQKK